MLGTLLEALEEYHIVSEIAEHYNFMSGINYELKQKCYNNQILAPCKAVGEINYIKNKDRYNIMFIITKNHVRKYLFDIIKSKNVL